MIRILLAALAVPLLAYAGLAVALGRDRVWPTLFGPPDRTPVDFATLTLPKTPNTHLVCPPGLCPAPHEESPVFPAPADRLARAVADLLAREAAEVWPGMDGGLEAEVRTPLLRFPDRISVRVLPAGPDASTLALYSRSVYGRGDLGTNARRVRRWLAILAGTAA